MKKIKVKIKMEIQKLYKGEEIYSLRDIAIMLDVPKYQIKNWVKQFSLVPIIVENRTGYFNNQSLIPFIEYVRLVSNFDQMKKDLKSQLISDEQC